MNIVTKLFNSKCIKLRTENCNRTNQNTKIPTLFLLHNIFFQEKSLLTVVSFQTLIEISFHSSIFIFCLIKFCTSISVIMIYPQILEPIQFSFNHDPTVINRATKLCLIWYNLPSKLSKFLVRPGIVLMEHNTLSIGQLW